MDFSNRLIKINQDLLAKGISLRIERRGKWLNLRGPLPSTEKNNLFKNQRISLRLAASHEGLQEAEKILQLVLIQLKHKQFDWNHWKNQKIHDDLKTKSCDIQEAIKNFEKAFFKDPLRRRSPAGSKTTWRSAYQPYLRRLSRLAKDNELNLDTSLLYKTLLSYSENSRSRQQCATTLNSLANHFQIQLPDNWRTEAGGYGLNKASFREIPNDNLIVKTISKIPNPSWKLVFGLMAAYGLRNHEVFFCDLSSLKTNGDHVLRVLPFTKTGEHQVWPFHPEWVERFGLEQLGEGPNILPSITTDLRKTTLQQVGRRVAEQFRRYKLPITPYDLRHAWAIRTIHIGLPDTVAARMMGHSVAIHTRTYHHWITKRDQQQAVDTALARKPA